VRELIDGCQTAENDVAVAQGMATRINPRYILMPDGNMRYVSGIAWFSEDWKAHGGDNNVISPIVHGDKRPLHLPVALV
jgi:hypothetical protein